MKATRVARKLRVRIGRFSGDLSKGLCLPAQRFVSEMVYGIQASQSVMLTEIGRALDEPISLHKTEDRLSRNLQRPELEDTVQNNVLRLAAPHIGKDTVRAHTQGRGIWVIDRGGDRINLFAPLLEWNERFLVRLVGQRHLLYKGEPVLASQLARTCPCHHRHSVVRIKGDQERAYELRFGFCRVQLPERPEPLYLLVIHGFGSEPLMLLTTEKLRNSFKCLWHWIHAYIKRWSIEETIRCVKTCYDLENVRVLNYQGLQNLMPLVLSVMFFAARVLDHDTRLRVMAAYVERAAKRIFGIPNFKYYALADGLTAIFTRHPGPPVTRIRPPTGVKQLLLFEFTHT